MQLCASPVLVQLNGSSFFLSPGLNDVANWSYIIALPSESPSLAIATPFWLWFMLTSVRIAITTVWTAPALTFRRVEIISQYWQLLIGTSVASPAVASRPQPPSPMATRDQTLVEAPSLHTPVPAATQPRHVARVAVAFPCHTCNSNFIHNCNRDYEGCYCEGFGLSTFQLSGTSSTYATGARVCVCVCASAVLTLHSLFKHLLIMIITFISAAGFKLQYLRVKLRRWEKIFRNGLVHGSDKAHKTPPSAC